ncbi:MAG TPA: FtsX-like permease family protein, partial [Pseudolabrys sp.]
GSAGLLLANWGTDLLVSLSPPYLLGLQNVEINAPVLIFTLAVSLATSVFIGLAPAYELSRLDLHEVLKESGRGGADSKFGRRLRALFVIGEIALALALLVGAGLLINSFAHLQAVDPGFNPQNLLTMGVSRNWQQPERQRIEFFKQAVERLQSIPGVTAAGAVSALPLTGSAAGVRFFIEGRPKPLPGQHLLTRVLVTDANYFRTMQIPLRHGRLYTEQETTEARGLVVINEALARRYFPNEDPLGKQVTIHSRPPGRNPPVEIIGIVGDVKLDTMEKVGEPTVYWPHSELALPGMTLVMRTSGDRMNVIAAARAAIYSLDPEQPIADLSTMESWLANSMGRARFITVLLAVFASVALMLASVGVYGVMAYAVAQRNQEIGIRMALGAQTKDVLMLVIREGMALALIGIAIGMLAAFVLTRWMETLLFEVRPTDPLTYTIIAAVLALVTLISCWIPARRAAKVDPLIALRSIGA